MSSMDSLQLRAGTLPRLDRRNPYLLPFESAMLAMLLEQSKEIAVLQQKLEELMAKNG